jgi:hypothetical protein
MTALPMDRPDRIAHWETKRRPATVPANFCHPAPTDDLSHETVSREHVPHGQQKDDILCQPFGVAEE